MPTTCSSPFRPRPTTPPRPRRSPTRNLVILWSWGRGPLERDSRGGEELAAMDAPSMPPTRTTCSPGSEPPGIRAEPAVRRARRVWHVLRSDPGRNVRSECAGGVYRCTTRFARTLSLERHALESGPRPDPSLPFAVVTPQPYATSDPFVAPRWQHWNLGVQRRLYSRGLIDLGYVGWRGDHLLRYVDFNQPQREDRGHASNMVRPFAGLDAIFMRETTAQPLSRVAVQLSSRGWPCRVRRP